MEKELTYEKMMLRLNDIAKELGVQLEEDIVLGTYFKRYPGVSNELADKIFPIWFTPEKRVYSIEMDENGIVIAIQKEKGGKWELVITK